MSDCLKNIHNKLKFHLSMFKRKERAHFLRATMLPLAVILDGLVCLITLGLIYSSFGFKAMKVINGKELGKIIAKKEQNGRTK